MARHRHHEAAAIPSGMATTVDRTLLHTRLDEYLDETANGGRILAREEDGRTVALGPAKGTRTPSVTRLVNGASLSSAPVRNRHHVPLEPPPLGRDEVSPCRRMEPAARRAVLRRLHRLWMGIGSVRPSARRVVIAFVRF